LSAARHNRLLGHSEERFPGELLRVLPDQFLKLVFVELA
jgi:hypothetical protein